MKNVELNKLKFDLEKDDMFCVFLPEKVKLPMENRK